MCSALLEAAQSPAASLRSPRFAIFHRKQPTGLHVQRISKICHCVNAESVLSYTYRTKRCSYTRHIINERRISFVCNGAPMAGVRA